MEDFLLNSLKMLQYKINVMQKGQKDMVNEFNELDNEKSQCNKNIQILVEQKMENYLDNMTISALIGQLINKDNSMENPMSTKAIKQMLTLRLKLLDEGENVEILTKTKKLYEKQYLNKNLEQFFINLSNEMK